MNDETLPYATEHTDRVDRGLVPTLTGMALVVLGIGGALVSLIVVSAGAPESISAVDGFYLLACLPIFLCTILVGAGLWIVFRSLRRYI